MKSSSGQYYVALDHVRGFAAFLVFAWHFTHGRTGYPIPFEFTPTFFPMALFDEGHTGVALFMVLSGYLFAKLLDGKKINYPAFVWNRFLRLVPLLALVVLIVGFQEYFAGHSVRKYAKYILRGLHEPTLPNGGWSITVEFHFYLLLPLLLWLSRKSGALLLGAVAAALLVRTFLYQEIGQIQKLAYWTLCGRVDQFVFGIFAYQFRRFIQNRHLMVIGGLVCFCLFYWYFDLVGGFYKNPSYPSPSRIWIFLPTLEGLVYSLLISWYDNSFVHPDNIVSRFFARIGAYSYSIYLLHFFFVFEMARFAHERILPLNNYYLALLFSVFGFLLIIPLSHLSYQFLESPFLKHRKRYIIEEKPENPTAPLATDQQPSASV